MEGREGILALRDRCEPGDRRLLASVDVMPWIDALPPDPTAVLRHLHREMGRLGIELDKLSLEQRAVLQDAESWLDRGLADTLAQVMAQAAPDLESDRGLSAAPWRVRAVITRRGALNLRWEPLIRRRPGDRGGRSLLGQSHLHVVGTKNGRQDLQGARRSAVTVNQAVLLRSAKGLGGAHCAAAPKPALDPISILLIFLVRRCYEIFLESLRRRVEVDSADQFVFTFERTELKPFQKLRSWKIVETSSPADNLVALENLRGAAHRWQG